MPSRFLTHTARNLSQGGAVRRGAAQLAQQVSRGQQTIPVRGPFSGFIPDVDPNLIDGGAFTKLQNCLARSHGMEHGEVLGLPDGYRQVSLTGVGAGTLPLGDGATIPASPTADGTAVLRIDQMTRWTPATAASGVGEFGGQFILTPMVVTAGDGTTNLSGNMYRVNASSLWTHARESDAVSDARALKAGRDGRSQSPSMPDSCVAPFGALARAANTAAPNDNLQSGPISEPAWIFTNDVDEVMVFPSHSSAVTGTQAGNHWYEPLCDGNAAGSPELDGNTDTTGFRAKSCETWNGRVYFLNTSEAGVRHSQRLRRTAKFTCDPRPVTPGAGFYDFREFTGEGLRIETLGDVLTVYFTDGVAFMRPTGIPTMPDFPQIISTERGLMGTHSMCSIGRNTHFGIFTDGWWLLDASGRWQEVGVTELGDKVVPKWRQTFYDDLPTSQRHRLYCYYDQPNNLVYIAKPTTDQPDPQEVWIWDPTSDRVFLENYPVTCFGTITPLSQAGVTIDALVGTIDAQTGTIDSFAPVVGFVKTRTHGDLDGFVYSHRRDVEGFDSPTRPPVVQEPAWEFATGLRSPGGLRNLTTVDRVSIEYFNHENAANVNVEVRGPVADGTPQSATVLLNEGAFEDVRYKDSWFRYTTTNPGVSVSGSGVYHIRSLEVDVFVDPLEPRSQDTP